MAGHPGVIPHRTLHALCIITFIILMVCSLSVSGRFSVIGLDQPLVVPPGEDAVLPCHLSPPISAENLTLRWFRGNYFAVVHLYHNGKDQYEEQRPEYRGRTALIKTDIRFGIVSMIIHNVTPPDSGQYTCFFDAGSFYEEAKVELKVAGVGSHPHIYLEESQNGGIQVVCISSGWYPEPEVQWKDDKGENISSSLEVNTPEGSLRFHIKTTYIIIGDAKTFSCCINNSALNQWKESTIHISDSFFQSVSTCSLTRIFICASFTLLVIAFLSLVVCIFKRRIKRVTLDPYTANPELVLSEGRRHVKCTGMARTLPYNPRRFTNHPCVLGSEGFTSGRHYWVLQLLHEGMGWSVGVAGKSMNRKAYVPWTPEWGVWSVRFLYDQYHALTSPETLLSLRNRPSKLGVFLDYEGGWLTVYNADTMELLYTFTQASFTQRIFPLFCLWNGAELRLL